MAKQLIIAAVIHIALISIIWVGLPVPVAKNKVVFSYSELMAAAPISNAKTENINFNSKGKDVNESWQNIRQVDKPKRF